MNPVQRTSGPNFPLQQTSSTAVPLVPPPLGHVPPPPPKQPPPISGHLLPHQPVVTPPNQSTQPTYQYPYQYPYSYYSSTPTETHPSNLTSSQGDGLLPTPPAAVPLYVPTWAQQHQTNTTGNKTSQTSLTSSSASSQEISLSDNEPNDEKPPLNQNTDKSETVQETNSQKVKVIDNSLDDKSSFESQSDDSKPIKMNFSKGFKGKRTGPTISVKLKTQTEVTKKPKLEHEVSKTVADAFGNDSEEEEEMPREAKLRMRNIGKDTPTSSGPNSFSKSAKGFLDSYSILRKEQDWC